LMGQRKLAEARKALDVLTREQPADSTIRNLQSLLAQEEQEEKRRKRLEVELTNLRSMVGAGKLRAARWRSTSNEGMRRNAKSRFEDCWRRSVTAKPGRRRDVRCRNFRNRRR